MKKIILVLAIAAVGMVSFAQKITVNNELYSEVIEKSLLKNSSSKFWGIRDRLYGKVEGDRWAVEARFGVKFGDDASGADYVLSDDGLMANIWLDPWDFLTVAAGTGLGYSLSPVNMVARGANMDNGNGKWADRSIAAAVRPTENLLVGVAIPIPTDINDQFQLQLGAQYKLFDAINLAAKYHGVFGKPVSERRNDLGFYADYVGFENLRIAAGFSGHFYDDSSRNRSLIDVAADYKWNAFVFAADATITIGSFDKYYGFGSNFVPFTVAVYANYALDENKFDIYARAMLALNQYCLNRDITAAVPFDGAMSLLIKPGVKFTLNDHHSFGAEVSMGFGKMTKNDDLGFGISFPVYWKYTF